MICRLTGIFRLMGQSGKLLIVPAAFLITFYPFNGLSMAEYILSVNPSFSIGSIAFLFVILWQQLGRKPLLTLKELFIFSIWNIVVSLGLFTFSLGISGFDLYFLGYGFSLWFVITALLTIILFLIKSRLSYIFISYILAFDLKLLYSENFFDYITDAVLLLMSFGMILFYLLKLKKWKPVYG